MSRRMFMALLVVAFGVSGLPVKAADHGKSAVKWQHDLKTAHRISQRDNKPMLLVFCATWCGPCKKLTGKTMEDPRMAEYINKNFVPVHLDADRDERVVEILKVESLPTTIILSPNADLIGRYTGYAEVEGYHKNLAKSHALHSKIQRVAVQPGGPTTR